MVYKYNIYEKIVMAIINSLSNFAIFPTIFLIYYQKNIFTYYVSYFSMVVSVMYHICESLDVKIFLEQLKWHELDNIGAIYSFSQMTLPLTIFNNDINYKTKKNYIFFFFLLFIQQRGPWEIINTILPLVIDFSFALISIIIHGIPYYNKSILKKACFFMCISLFLFYQGLDDLNDYLRLWHAIWHIFIGITSFYFLQIQEEKYISFKEIFLIHFGYYKNKRGINSKEKEVMII